MKSKFLVLFVCFAVLLGAAACSNTFDGVGRDMESAGQKIQNTF